MNKNEFYSKVDQPTLLDTIQTADTPHYFYFSSIIESQLGAIRRCTRNQFDIHFAVKANPNHQVLEFLAGHGVGADVASIGEFDHAIAAGIPAADIEFSGPGKRDVEIKRALTSGVGMLNVESIQELHLVRQISKSIGIRAPIGIRINPGRRDRTSGLQMAGDTQFGIIDHDLPAIVEILGSSGDCLEFRGLHAHLSSQELSAQILAENIRFTSNFATKFAKEWSLEIQKINFGGGWGINYFPNQSSLDLRELEDLLFEQPLFTSAPKKILEPGRFLVGESGIFVTRVLYKKKSENRVFLITDGGMNANYVLAGGMGQIIRRNFEIDVLSKREDRVAGNYTYDIAGPLCTPQDIIAKNFEADFQIETGDLVVFFNCGAYGPSASPINFLSHSKPGETVVFR